MALIDNQVSELIEAVRSLRDWELATTDDGITRSALVAQCVALLRSAFDLHGVSLDADASLDPQEDEHRWPAAAALRYLFLGALGYLHDGAAEARRSSRGRWCRMHCASRPCRASLAAPAVLDAPAHRAPWPSTPSRCRTWPEDLGYAVALDGDGVRPRARD